MRTQTSRIIFELTGETRPPKRGEYYIRPNSVEGAGDDYVYAVVDLETEKFPILRCLEVKSPCRL